MAKIGEADGGKDTSIGGSEKFPVDDGGVGKYIETGDMKDYVIEQIEGISAGSDVVDADGIYILDNGVLKPVLATVIAQYVMNAMWGKDEETSPDDVDEILLNDAGTEKTLGLDTLADYIQTYLGCWVAGEDSIYDLSNLTDGSPAQATDYVLITRGTDGKRVQISDLNTAIYAGLVAHVTGLTALSDPDLADADVLYIIDGGVTAKKTTLADLALYINGGSIVTGTGSTGFLTKWADTDEVTDGPSIITTKVAAGSANAMPTTGALRLTLDELIEDESIMSGNVASDDMLLIHQPAPDDIQHSVTLAKVWEYMKGALGYVTDLSDIGDLFVGVAYGWFLDEDTMVSDDATKVASQQSIKKYVDGVSAIPGAITDSDTVVVNTGSRYTATFTNIWTWIVTKLAAVTDISSYSWFLDENDMASDDATKVVSQQSLKEYVSARNSLFKPANFTLLTAAASRIRLEWMAGQYGKPGLNADVACPTPSAAEIATMLLTDKQFEIAGTNAASANVTYIPEGGLSFVTAGANLDEIILQPHLDTNLSAWSQWTWGTDRETIWECFIQTGANINNCRIWAGLKLTNTSVSATDANQAFFRYEDDVNGGLWQAVSSSGGTDDEYNTLVAAASGTHYHLAIVFAADRTAKYYIDGVLKRTSPWAINTDDLIPYIGIMADGAAAGKTLFIYGQTIERDEGAT